LAADRNTWTGSLHIIDLAGDEAANEFVEHEPYNRAGLFESHVVRRFENLLGRTMWEFPREPNDPRFLVLAGLRSGFPRAAAHGAASLPRERLIIHGELSAPGSDGPDGVLLAIEAPDRDAVEEHLAGPTGPFEGVDLEIHDWEFGGRR
jgi:hypothetical protein